MRSSWTRATMAPMSIGFIERRADAKRLHARSQFSPVSFSATLSCINRREPAQQTWP